MALVSALAVAVGGGVGAVLRYAVGLAVRRYGLDTLVVNVAGSFLFGAVLGIEPEGAATLALGAGFCGAFTTFSSFAVETVRLAEEEPTAALANAAGTLVAALIAVIAGNAVVSAVV